MQHAILHREGAAHLAEFRLGVGADGAAGQGLRSHNRLHDPRNGREIDAGVFVTTGVNGFVQVRSTEEQGLPGPGMADPSSAIPALIERLKTTKDWKVIRVIGAMGPVAKAAVPALADALDDFSTRLSASQALGKIGPEAKAAVPALLKKLGGKPWYGQVDEAIALLRISPSHSAAAVRVLIDGLGRVEWDGNDGGVRCRAAEALSEVGSESAVAALERALKDHNAHVRDAVAQALTRIGEKKTPLPVAKPKATQLPPENRIIPAQVTVAPSPNEPVPPGKLSIVCECGHRGYVKAEYAGRIVACPKCARKITVPR